MAKLDSIRFLAGRWAGWVSQSPADWMRFMDTASRMYRYSFPDQLLIYAQRPNATACASLETWNTRLNRWVNRGAKGIALIDDNQQPAKLRYVFDVADTHARYGDRLPYIWRVEGRHIPPLLAHLAYTYSLPDASSLESMLSQIANQVAEDYLDDALYGIEQEMTGSRLAQLPEARRREIFHGLFESSILYETMRRCGLNPETALPERTFNNIRYFNRPRILGVLGGAVSNACENILMDIGREIRAIDRENLRIPLAKRENMVYNDFNVVKRESDTSEGGNENGIDVSAPGRLPVSESGDRIERDGTHRPVRDAAEGLSEGASSGLVSEHVADGQAGRAPVGDRPERERADGTADKPDGRAGGRDGSPERDEPVGVGAADEQYTQPGGGDRADGVDLQLIETAPDGQPEETTEDIREAEAEAASAFALPGLPTVQRQIHEIEERAAAVYAGTLPFPADVVDEILRTGGNRSGTLYRLTYNFMVGQSRDERVEYVRQEYRTGGKGFTINGADYAVWFDRSGMQIARGRTVHTAPHNTAFLSWEQVTDRIHQLLQQGEFAPQATLEGARDYVLKACAQALVYMERDVEQEYKPLLFDDPDLFAGTFPEAVERGAAFLEVQENIGMLTARLQTFAEQYAQNREMMRSPTYNPTRMSAVFERLARPWAAYQSREDFHPQEPATFITEDEVDAALTGGALYENSRLTIYAYWLTTESRTERASFLRQHYGEGGRSHAVSGADQSDEMHGARGITLRKGAAVYRLTWPNVVQRIDALIRNDLYLTASDHAKMPEYERGVMAGRILRFYRELPSDVERPFQGAYDPRPEIARMLENTDSAVSLLSAMTEAMTGIPEETEAFERISNMLFQFYDYVDGSYTIFPEPPWKATPEREQTRQLSMFDQFELPGGLPDENAVETEAEGVSIAGNEAQEETGVEGSSPPETSGTLSENAQPDEEPSAADEKAIHTAETPEEDSGEQLPENAPAIGQTLHVDGRSYEIESISALSKSVHLRDLDFQRENGYPISRVEPYSVVQGWLKEQAEPWIPGHEPGEDSPLKLVETVITLAPRSEQEEQIPSPPEPERHNFHITDAGLGAGGPKARFRMNMEAILLLKRIEAEGRLATPEEQETLSHYVGWGSVQEAFEADNPAWKNEHRQLLDALTPEEFDAARATTLNAFYTSPTVIQAMYEALENMGFHKGNILEPSCGVGNFMGMLPESMRDARMYGVEIDSITGRIAQQLYQRNTIVVQGFEDTSFPDNFFDVVIGNVPFGAYKVIDRQYDRHNFLIHDYFIARSVDLVRPGGVVAVISSSGTMDKQSDGMRRYVAARADLLGAIRLPRNAFQRNSGTSVVTDVLFFQKRESAAIEQPEWVGLAKTPEGFDINAYFVRHPEMILGTLSSENTQYAAQAFTVEPIPGADLAEQLRRAMQNIHGTILETELSDTDLEENIQSLPADPEVRNFSYTVVNGRIYYRENSVMNPVDLPQNTAGRVMALIQMRDSVRQLLDAQLADASDAQIKAMQRRLDAQYDSFTRAYGLINTTANRRAFQQDSGYSLLSSLEILDEDGRLKRKADIFTKRTIRKPEPVDSVDTASEALALSIGEKACVDLKFMSSLCGKTEREITDELRGVIFQNPVTHVWETSDEYLSGDVRRKLREAEDTAKAAPEYAVNAEALRRVQPKELDASEIEVRLGATWIDPVYIDRFLSDVLSVPAWMAGRTIRTQYSPVSGAWNISGKSSNSGNALIYTVYGTEKANALHLLEDALNLKDAKIYMTVQTLDGEKRVLDKKATILAQQKQEMLRAAFKEWIFKDMNRREALVKKYNELFNSVRPREYDGSHIRFVGMSPEISLMPHQKNAVAHILYGGNTLLAHCVGAGKTFQMIAAGMEARRLGLSQKNLYVVPNHLTEQWGADFLRLYPGANILVATRRDFEPANRKKFCSRIATGDYDAIIIGHSQFEKIPISRERQLAMLKNQIDDIAGAIEEAKRQRGERFTIKQMERTRKGLEARLKKLNDQSRKDDVVTFEQLGVDRLFVDESHAFKNLFLYTKMVNVAGIQQTDAQKSSDMFLKCRYMDEITGGRGIVFATGTPVSNSMVELYTIMRYLQYSTLERMGMRHFDSWAATFGDTVSAIELAPEGTGYRARTRFARFFNLPELISVFKEAADIQTADMLSLPVPEAEFVNVTLKPSEIQREYVSSFSERADRVRSGAVDPSVDNMLRITNDGRKCALDQRLMQEMLPDDEGSKVNACVRNAFAIWQSGIEKRTAQLIFCDLSTPKGDGRFNIYDDVRNKLVQMGVPREEIAFIHEAATETQKAELFARVRAGQVRILLGSTAKLGAGTNVQDRLIALHHLDAPWKPSDLEQQEGRILRQGNMNPKVQIFRYVTEGSFDAYMWQILETKQKFIAQVMTSKSPVRACQDVDDTALSYAEIKALATGNPEIKQKMDLDIQVARLKMLKANHVSQHYRLETDIARTYPSQITAEKERIENLSRDIDACQPILDQGKDHFQIVIAGKSYTDRKEAGAALIQACTSAGQTTQEVPIGEYGGFQLMGSFNLFSHKYELTVHGRGSYAFELGADPFGNLTRLNNIFSGLQGKLEQAQQRLATVEGQLENAKREVSRPFPQEQELAEKQARLAELNSRLNIDERSSEASLIDEDARDEKGDAPETGDAADAPEESFSCEARRISQAVI